MQQLPGYCCGWHGPSAGVVEGEEWQGNELGRRGE